MFAKADAFWNQISSRNEQLRDVGKLECQGHQAISLRPARRVTAICAMLRLLCHRRDEKKNLRGNILDYGVRSFSSNRSAS
jgi:hypothetical protein